MRGHLPWEGPPLPEGLEVRKGARRDRLRLTFHWHGKRYRETLPYMVTPESVRLAARLRANIIKEIREGTFSYAEHFPDSRRSRLQAREKPARRRVGELIDAYIDLARQGEFLSPASIRTYENWGRARLKPKFGQRFVDDLTTPELRTWIVGLSAELAPKSIRNCVSVLAAVLNRAVEDRLIADSPLARIRLRSVIRTRRSDEGYVDPFNSDEISAILAACESVEERALFQFAFCTGMRTGEQIAFKWKHIRSSPDHLVVRDNIVTGEISRGRAGPVEKDTKTGSARLLPILPGAMAAIEAMKPISLNLDIGGYVFVAPGGGRWRNDQQIRNRWKIVLRRAGVRYRNPYQTRHTFASTLLAAGESETLVAKLLGHTTVEMVRRHYARYITEPGGRIELRADYSDFGDSDGDMPSA